MKTLLGLLFVLLIVSCQEPQEIYQFPYNLYEPNAVRMLPKTLKEVSGLSLLDPQTEELACVQDEAGIIYIYDWAKEEIVKKVDFQVFDDFEGVEIINDNGYLITSTGDLYEIPKMAATPIKRNINVGKPANIEGLGYDSTKNQLLILPKAELVKGKMLVFGYNLDNYELQRKTVFKLSNNDIKNYCNAHQIKYKIPKKSFPFAPSGIAIDPFTKNIYIIASVGKTICVLSPEGKLLFLSKLDKKIYPKPEGITFMPNGDLVIASEGKERGRLVRIKRKNK